LFSHFIFLTLNNEDYPRIVPSLSPPLNHSMAVKSRKNGEKNKIDPKNDENIDTLTKNHYIIIERKDSSVVYGRNLLQYFPVNNTDLLMSNSAFLYNLLIGI